MYMGLLPSGGTVQVSLKCDPGNRGSALLSLAYAKQDSNDSTAVAVSAGGSDTVRLKVPAAGWLRVWVDMNQESDVGQLVVAREGNNVASRGITGDTTWTFTVS